MARYYISTYPRKVGFTGREPLAAYLSSKRQKGETACDFFPLLGGAFEQEFGYIDGESDDLARVFEETSQVFSLKRITLPEFVGACKVFYNPQQGNPDIEPPTFIEWLDRNNIPADGLDILLCVKAYKSNLFKELSKRRFYDDNDAIADAMKSIMLYAVYKDSDLTPAQITTRDEMVAAVKNIYTPAVCVEGVTDMVGLLQEVLIGYYSAKTELEAADTVEEALAVVYDPS